MKNNTIRHASFWLLVFILCLSARSVSAQARLIFDEPDTTKVRKDIILTDSISLRHMKSLNSPLQKEANKNDSIAQENRRQLRAIEAPADTARLLAVNDSISENQKIALPKKQFVPDPQRALWLSLVFPGAGQIYNRKYWKLPIIYGGFLGCTYALLWNQQMYMDYSQAYLDIMDDDPNTDSYLDMLPPRYNITGQEERFKKIFKNKKDHFRRYRDLSAFCFVGVYILSVVDAYVDAQLSEFDITPDLSLRLQPAVIQQKGINQDKNAYGVGCSINF